MLNRCHFKGFINNWREIISKNICFSRCICSLYFHPSFPGFDYIFYILIHGANASPHKVKTSPRTWLAWNTGTHKMKTQTWFENSTAYYAKECLPKFHVLENKGNKTKNRFLWYQIVDLGINLTDTKKIGYTPRGIHFDFKWLLVVFLKHTLAK